MSSEPAEGAGKRLTPLAQEDWDDFLARLVDASGGPGHALNIFTTLGRHPELFRRWIAFGGSLLSGQLPGRVREMVILRTSVRTQADYEWVHHAATATQQGVSAEELGALRRPLADHAWSADDLELLRAVDEMHDTWTLADDTWSAMHHRFGDAGCIELVTLVGQYHLVALLIRTLGIAVEPGAARP